jgi:hypothetical protein
MRIASLVIALLLIASPLAAQTQSGPAHPEAEQVLQLPLGDP